MDNPVNCRANTWVVFLEMFWFVLIGTTFISFCVSFGCCHHFAFCFFLMKQKEGDGDDGRLMRIDFSFMIKSRCDLWLFLIDFNWLIVCLWAWIDDLMLMFLTFDGLIFEKGIGFMNGLICEKRNWLIGLILDCFCWIDLVLERIHLGFHLFFFLIFFFIWWWFFYCCWMRSWKGMKQWKKINNIMNL